LWFYLCALFVQAHAENVMFVDFSTILWAFRMTPGSINSFWHMPKTVNFCQKLLIFAGNYFAGNYPKKSKKNESRGYASVK
jgi:hypothetical protein